MKQELAGFETIYFLSFKSSKVGWSGPGKGKRVSCAFVAICVKSLIGVMLQPNFFSI